MECLFVLKKTKMKSFFSFLFWEKTETTERTLRADTTTRWYRNLSLPFLFERWVQSRSLDPYAWILVRPDHDGPRTGEEWVWEYTGSRGVPTVSPRVSGRGWTGTSAVLCPGPTSWKGPPSNPVYLGWGGSRPSRDTPSHLTTRSDFGLQYPCNWKFGNLEWWTKLQDTTNGVFTFFLPTKLPQLYPLAFLRTSLTRHNGTLRTIWGVRRMRHRGVSRPL